LANYQKLLEGIFMCGQEDVKSAAEEEHAAAVIDLRAETVEPVMHDDRIEWIHIPLVDGVPNQTEKLKEAVNAASAFHKEGKTAILH
jgi:protein-tyrosine phosphatase